jgi:hypothetical protein
LIIALSVFAGAGVSAFPMPAAAVVCAHATAPTDAVASSTAKSLLTPFKANIFLARYRDAPQFSRCSAWFALCAMKVAHAGLALG